MSIGPILDFISNVPLPPAQIMKVFTVAFIIMGKEINEYLEQYTSKYVSKDKAYSTLIRLFYWKVPFTVMLVFGGFLWMGYNGLFLAVTGIFFGWASNGTDAGSELYSLIEEYIVRLYDQIQKGNTSQTDKEELIDYIGFLKDLFENESGFDSPIAKRLIDHYENRVQETQEP